MMFLFLKKVVANYYYFMLYLGCNEVVLLFYEKKIGCGVVKLSLGNSSTGTETEREVMI